MVVNRARIVRFSLAILCTLVVWTPPFSAQATDSPEAVARALQKRYEGIRDFTADFVHTYRGGVLRTETREQ